ncbi:hypothetical protein HZB93_00345 [Candidatus Falkowbacteria bacterium]|nr:hypothetical protein [Candidatus Falkowbacteria bacterium]
MFGCQNGVSPPSPCRDQAAAGLRAFAALTMARSSSLQRSCQRAMKLSTFSCGQQPPASARWMSRTT